MAKGKARTFNIGVMNRVHRPHLTPAQMALQAQYQPSDPCRHCAEAGRKSVEPGSPYVPDPSESTPDRREFFCVTCGYHVTVALTDVAPRAL